MKVFISSVISGFGEYRSAAARAVLALGYEVIRAEDFGASTGSPQQACLAGVREADLTVLLLGARYGARQASGLSATHEEYREARGTRPVLAFVQDDAAPERDQVEFIAEVRQWETGNLTVGFNTGDDLQEAVTRELHRHVLSVTARPIDDSALLERARDVLPGWSIFGREPQVIASLAWGPDHEILRPSELQSAEFARKLQQEALFGEAALFAPETGTQSEFRSGRLVLSQKPRTIEISSAGDIITRQSALTRSEDRSGFDVIVEEDIEESLARALTFSATVLSWADPSQRLSHAAVVAALTDTGYQTWRTRDEHARSPNSISPNLQREKALVHLNPAIRTRSEIHQRPDELATDLTVLLRSELTR